VHLDSLTATVKTSDLLPSAVAQGAAVGPDTPDGLYLYTAASRLAAGEYLYGAVTNMAQDLINSKAGGSFVGDIFEAITKTATHLGNEILNSFADDHTALSDDSSAWQNTKDANAVSPQNTTYWLAADKLGGTYGNFGYAEPAVYREPDLETVTVYRWNKVTAKGTLKGRVTFNNEPVKDVLVQLNASIFAHSGGNGDFEINDVPYGDYVAKAEVRQNGDWLSASPKVSIKEPIQTVEIALKTPSDLYRTAHVTGTLYILWTHSWTDGLFDHERQHGTFPFDFEIEVGPNNTHGQATFSQNVQSATGAVTVVVDWKPDKSIECGVTFQQDDETNPGQPDNAPLSFNIPENEGYTWQNWGSGSRNDRAVLSFDITNELQET
jgi:hypothetical protein